MNNLLQWQAGFFDALNSLNEPKPVLNKFLNKKLQHRLTIYQNCSRETFLQALRLSYPHCLQLLGQPYFDRLAGDFIDLQTVIADNLDDFGESLPSFMPDWLEKNQQCDLDYLPSLAKTDWLIQQSYHAEERTPFDFFAYATLDEQSQTSAIFKLAPSVRLLSSDWPTKDIVDWHNQGAQPELQLKPENCFYIIWRPQWIPLIEVINESQYRLLNAIRNKISFAELAHGEQKEDLLSIPEWIQRGWISGFSANNTERVILKNV